MPARCTGRSTSRRRRSERCRCPTCCWRGRSSPSGSRTWAGTPGSAARSRRTPVAGRPQEPKPPFPYRIEDVKYPGQGVDIAGTLTLPQGPGPFTTVLLLTGSGAQNRDEEIFGHKPFLLLADVLTRAGYAVLRVDDRGIGGSTGSLYDSDYDQLTGDAVAGVEYLRTRPEIDRAKIGLLGHSEGGYLVPQVAQRTPIAFAIMMAAPAAPGEQVLALQSQLLLEAAGAPPEVVSDQLAYVRTLVALLRAEDYQRARAVAVRQLVSQATGLPPEQQPSPDQIEAQVAATVNPYYRSWAVYDPAPALQALRVPVLAFFGGADQQVSAGQNEPLMRSLLSADPDATVRTLPGLNYLMQPAGTGGLDEYATIDTTIDPSALDLVRSWLTQRFPV
jgi:pimeloyl-ACP methyl ester carboxylesterase